MSHNALAWIIFIMVVLVLFTGKRRTRHIPAKSKHLAKAKYIQEFYNDPKNEGKRMRMKDLEHDHEFPFSKGGGHDPENIRLITRKENRKKGSKRP